MIDEFKENNIDELIEDLLKAYPENTNDINTIDKILSQLSGTQDKNQLTQLIEQLQEINNKLYDIHSDETLIDLQVIINMYRNKYDITDPREIIHTDNGRGFVQ